MPLGGVVISVMTIDPNEATDTLTSATNCPSEAKQLAFIIVSRHHDGGFE